MEKTIKLIPRTSNLTASCHCNAVTLPIELPPNFTDQDLPLEIPLCHCSVCRHSTGLLCTSYMPISAPPDSALANTTVYTTTQFLSPLGVQRYFCSLCGCHMFRSQGTTSGDGANDKRMDGEKKWEVATGVLSDVLSAVRISRNESVPNTVDGGLSIYITEQNLRPLPAPSDATISEHRQQHATASNNHEVIDAPDLPAQKDPQSFQSMTESDVLRAYCACHTVEFHISRPNTASLTPQSPFPDLMLPYHTRDPLIPNPHDEKWWLRSPAVGPVLSVAPGKGGNEAEEVVEQNKPSRKPSLHEGVKYLAGTCACRSCRLTSGFEIQTWAFVPRTNIYLHLPPLQEDISSLPPLRTHSKTLSPSSTTDEISQTNAKKTITPLDFSTLRARVTHNAAAAGKEPGLVLKAYESSPGVLREFCATCGATVFWHDKWRPDLIDVSVGLLDAGQGGARAEGWLDWWLERVSFAEDAGRGADVSGVSREEEEDLGQGGKERWDLIPALERGLRRRAASGERIRSTSMMKEQEYYTTPVMNTL